MHSKSSSRHTCTQPHPRTQRKWEVWTSVMFWRQQATIPSTWSLIKWWCTTDSRGKIENIVQMKWILSLWPDSEDHKRWKWRQANGGKSKYLFSPWLSRSSVRQTLMPRCWTCSHYKVVPQRAPPQLVAMLIKLRQQQTLTPIYLWPISGWQFFSSGDILCNARVVGTKIASGSKAHMLFIMETCSSEV